MTLSLQEPDIEVRRGEEFVNQPVPALSFAGPHTVPMVSVNPGPARAFMLVLLPQAFHALTGLDLSAWVNRVGPVDAVLDGAWPACNW